MRAKCKKYHAIYTNKKKNVIRKTLIRHNLTKIRNRVNDLKNCDNGKFIPYDIKHPVMESIINHVNTIPHNKLSKGENVVKFCFKIT